MRKPMVTTGIEITIHDTSELDDEGIVPLVRVVTVQFSCHAVERVSQLAPSFPPTPPQTTTAQPPGPSKQALVNPTSATISIGRH